MKTSLFELAVIATIGMSSISTYAKDEMAMTKSEAKAISEKSIESKGTVVLENKSKGYVTLQHEAIPALGWGPMTMEFKVKDKMLLDKVKIGDKVKFTLLQQGKDYVITRIK